MFSHYKHACSTWGKLILDHYCVEACTIGWSFSALIGFTRMAFLLKTLDTNVHTRMIQDKIQIYEPQMFTVCVLKDIFYWYFVEPIQTFNAGNDFVNIIRNNIEVSASQSHDMFISVICRRKNSSQCILSPSRSLIQQPASRSAAQANIS